MRIIIEVITPGNGKTYELMLEDTLNIDVAREKVIEQITTFENGNIAFDKDVALFSPITRTPLPDYKTLRTAGIKGGQAVYLL